MRQGSLRRYLQRRLWSTDGAPGGMGDILCCVDARGAPIGTDRIPLQKDGSLGQMWWIHNDSEL